MHAAEAWNNVLNGTINFQVVTNKSQCLKETGNHLIDISQHKKSDE